MKIPQKKCCDMCGKTVAEKKVLFWSTNIDFITLKLKEKPTWADEEIDAFCFSKMHICYHCWLELRNQVKKYTEEGK